jgi:hypothetical protein
MSVRTTMVQRSHAAVAALPIEFRPGLFAAFWPVLPSFGIRDERPLGGPPILR